MPVAILRRLVLSILILALTAVAGSARTMLPASAQTPPSQPARLPGHVLPALASATKLAKKPQAASEPLTLTVVLNRADQSGFESFLNDVQNPHSANFRHFASQTDLTNRYGPSQSSYNAVLNYLKQQGFTLEQGSANRLTLTVQGTRAQAEQAFGVQINDYQLDGRSFHANDTDPTVPGNIAPYIQAVVGMSNLAVPRPNFAVEPATSSTPQTAPATTPMALAQAYNFGSLGTTGAGQKVGLVEYDTYNPNDISIWLNGNGLNPALASQVSQENLGVPATLNENGGELEVLLDIDTVLGMAPGATVVAYNNCGNDLLPGCTNPLDFGAYFNAMINDGDTVISNSWAECEGETTEANVAGMDSILQSAAASGISVFSASGDNGSTCNDPPHSYPNGVDVPADVPSGTAVGGTTLQVAAGGAYQSESWWYGGGFGVSCYFQTPSYQAGIATGSAPCAPIAGITDYTCTTGNCRSVPDVSADADPNTGVRIYDSGYGGWVQVGGTSLATPVWAAGIALINQKLGHPTGNLNAVLYAPATAGGFHPAGGMTGAGNDFAHLGLGSFDLGLLAASIGHPGLVSLLPSPTKVAVGSTTTVTLGAVTPSSLGAWNITVTYNTSVLSATALSACSTISTCSQSAPGTITISGSSPAGLSGSQTLANLTFGGVSASGPPSPLTVTVNSLQDALGYPLVAGVIAGAIDVATPGLGDVNLDGSVDSLDALCILRTVVGLGGTAACPQPLPGNPIIANGETSANGPTALDALCVLRGVAGLDGTANCPAIIAGIVVP